uniref:Uncharacterized protein n=1 Tax=Oryza punctata TaxID=4537 RepID=A0A0E0K0N7_ORYPU
MGVGSFPIGVADPCNLNHWNDASNGRHTPNLPSPSPSRIPHRTHRLHHNPLLPHLTIAATSSTTPPLPPPLLLAFPAYPHPFPIPPPPPHHRRLPFHPAGNDSRSSSSSRGPDGLLHSVGADPYTVTPPAPAQSPPSSPPSLPLPATSPSPVIVVPLSHHHCLPLTVHRSPPSSNWLYAMEKGMRIPQRTVYSYAAPLQTMAPSSLAMPSGEQRLSNCQSDSGVEWMQTCVLGLATTFLRGAELLLVAKRNHDEKIVANNINTYLIQPCDVAVVGSGFERTMAR